MLRHDKDRKVKRKISSWCPLLAAIVAMLSLHNTVWSSEADEDRSAYREAIKQVEIGTNAEILDHFIKQRPPILSDEARAFYKREMLARPELAHTPVLDSDSPEAKTVLGTIQPILNKYHRNGIEVLILKQEAPFVGLYRECLLLFSTKLLNLLTPAEVRAAAAHELSHEFFLDELKAADKAKNKSAVHLVEFKCDIVAAVGLLTIGDDPMVLAETVERIEDYYLNHNNAALETDRHPKAKLRKECLQQFLKTVEEARKDKS